MDRSTAAYRKATSGPGAASGPSFCCPDCHHSLSLEADTLACRGCANRFEVRDGIPRFASEDEFYEGRFQHTHMEPADVTRESNLRRWYLRIGWDYYTVRRRFFVRHLTRPGCVLDIGCAGGSEWMNRVGPVTGIDLSVTSLHHAEGVYARVAQAEIGRLPFPDHSFDYVVSADVIGHLDDGATEELLDDVERVLRPDGTTLHSIETFGALRGWARRCDPDLYEKHFVEAYGHIGMETPAAALARFKRRGWELTDVRTSMHAAFPVNQLLEGFDNEFVERSRLFALVVRGARAADSGRLRRFAANQALRVIDHASGAVLGPRSANVTFVAARAPA